MSEDEDDRKRGSPVMSFLCGRIALEDEHLQPRDFREILDLTNELNGIESNIQISQIQTSL